METIGELKSSPVMTRHSANPLLTAEDVPYKPALVFNPGVTKYEGRYVMAFRNDYGSVEKQELLPGHTTNIGIAYSDDGIAWQVEPKPCTALTEKLRELLNEFKMAHSPPNTEYGWG